MAQQAVWVCTVSVCVKTGFTLCNGVVMLATPCVPPWPCSYAYVVVGVSLAVSLAVSLLQCLTCNLCGLGKILDILLAAFGTVW